MRLSLWLRLRLDKLLPPLVKALRGRRKNRVVAYKDAGRWYVADFNGYSRDANELVDGIPQLIEHFVGPEAARVRIDYDERPFEGAKTLTLVATDEFGTWYEYRDERDVPHMGWLCPVFFWYFARPPAKLYALVSAVPEGSR